MNAEKRFGCNADVSPNPVNKILLKSDMQLYKIAIQLTSNLAI
jgi:hypothetical protein